MDKLKQKFIEEAFEHVDDIEQSLLALENDPDNHELIEKIFRAMHSLKGSGAMFGYEKISEFTHDLETVYDFIRNNKLILTKEIADITLSSADYIKMILKSEDGEIDKETEINFRPLKSKINSIVNADAGNTANKNEPEAHISDFSNFITYYIYFKPYPEIFNNGTNPLYLIDELASLGNMLTIAYLNDVKPLEEMDPHTCYTHWEMFIATKEELHTINDVFIFVEDNCKLEIQKIGNGNFLNNKKFVRKLQSLQESGKDIGIDQVMGMIKDVEQSVAFKLKKALGNERKTGIKDYSISSIRVSSEKLDNLMNLVSELVTTQARLSLFTEQDKSAELNGISENIQKLTRQLRDLAFEIVLVPIETLITRFQRLVRDLSNELKKDVAFIAKGTDTELDKTIIENLTDPLMHIIRNCVDHGIEPSEERLKKNKPAQGTIYLNAYHSSTNVHIEIIDDGKGIDTEKVRKKAISKGLINEDTTLNEKQMYDLLFMPGFSTAENVTDVSGRGVGMDVVKQKIANIRGEIEVESQKDKGTKLTLKIPITLSIIDGLLVKVDDTYFIIPLSAIQKIYAIDHNKIENQFNNLVILDGERIPYFSLRDEFMKDKYKDQIEQIVVIQYENQKVGLVVDYVVGEYQAVLKPLGKHYKNQEIVSAATILGDGTVALVIDSNRAVNYFSNQTIYQEEKI